MDTASFLRWLGEGKAYRSLHRHERAIAFAQGVAMRQGDRVVPTPYGRTLT